LHRKIANLPAQAEEEFGLEQEAVHRVSNKVVRRQEPKSSSDEDFDSDSDLSSEEEDEEDTDEEDETDDQHLPIPGTRLSPTEWRLPSGQIITSRASPTSSSVPQFRHKSKSRKQLALTSTEQAIPTQALAIRNTALSLAGLSDQQMRAIVATEKKQASSAARKESLMKKRLVREPVLTKYYKVRSITSQINTTASLTHPRPRTPSTKPVDATGLESKNARASEYGIAYTNNAHATNVSDARVRSPRRGADGDICFSRAGAGRERMSRRGQNALCTVCMNGLTCQRICRRLARTAHDANGRERIRGREGE
jgi:hypothetical protein